MYVDAIYNRENDEILVVERVNGKRRLRSYPAINRAYYPDPKGKYESIFGHRLTKIESSNSQKFNKDVYMRAKNLPLFESDINPVFRCLEENYLGQDAPEVNICFLDIETDFNPDLGFSDPWNPFAAITAITIYHTNQGKLITLVLKPTKKHKDGSEYVTYKEAVDIVAKFDDTYLFDDESELLDTFLTLIDDADILSGWNSTIYDIPYLVNRIDQILGKNSSKRFCLWGQKPRIRKFKKFGKEMKTYDTVGRVHLDYLELYMKHNAQQLHSYRLDFVGEIEVGENKEQYDGTFDQLYNEDFEHFIRYNRQDVMLLAKIDKKRKYIDLANQIAHTNAVLFKTTTGSVSLIEQAITLEAHSKGLIVPNRKKDFDDDDDVADISLAEDDEDDEDDEKAAVGAYVANPKKGLHDYIGAVDINSLYPSTIRALNISTETLFGQIRLEMTQSLLDDRVKNQGYKKSEAWDGIFAALEYDCVLNQTNDILTLDLEEGETLRLTGKELYDFIFKSDSKLVISANGTLFTRQREGVIPSLLTRWYAERKQMQSKAKKFGGMAHGADIKDKALMEALHEILPKSYESETEEYNVKHLEEIVKSGDIEALVDFALTNKLLMDGESLTPTKGSKKSWKEQYAFWDMRQLARKILLNSLYGALLNEACKFYDQRMGQSVTLTGRSISKHMNGRVNYEFTGVEDYKGDAVIYADTDSYFSGTIHKTNMGDLTAEELFEYCSIKWKNGKKEYSVDDKVKVLSYEPKTETAQYMPINYVYRHKVSKARWKVTDSLGNEIIVTGDHSIMVERNGNLIEVKPRDILPDDFLISVTNDK